MPWEERYATGHPEIDRQHRILFGMIDMVPANTQMEYADGVQVVLDLMKYVVQHFGYEERLMQTHGYPDIAAHRALHSELGLSVQRLRDGMAEGSIDQTELRGFLDSWLQHHIGGNDVQLAAFLAGRS
jgi:hemerythrin